MNKINFDQIAKYIKEGKTQWVISYSKLQLSEICQKFNIPTKKDENINVIRERIRNHIRQAVLGEHIYENISPFRKSTKITRSPTKSLDQAIESNNSNKTLDETVDNNTSNTTLEETSENNLSNIITDVQSNLNTDNSNEQNTLLNKYTGTIPKTFSQITKTKQSHNKEDSFTQKYTLATNVTILSENNTSLNDTQEFSFKQTGYQEIKGIENEKDITLADNTNTTDKNVTISLENNTTIDETLNDDLNISIKQESFREIEGIRIGENIIINNPNNNNNNNNNINNNNNNNNTIDDLVNFIENINMAQPGYSLKEITRLVPDFDGKNISVDKYIEKLEFAKELLDADQQKSFMNYQRFKLSGAIASAVKHTTINTIDEFIKIVKKLYPEIDNLYTLYGKLEQIQQELNEPVEGYITRIKELTEKIRDKKKNETGIERATLERFINQLNQDEFKYFKQGLVNEIRYEMKVADNFSDATIEAIKIEKQLEKQNAIRGNPNKQKIMFSNIFQEEIKQIQCCQICKNTGHEALYCNIAGCVYCKEPNHSSFECSNTKNKIRLICKFCNQLGHSRSTCDLLNDNEYYCQYCQESNHKINHCPIIRKYEICWKCNKNGHNPNFCTDVIERKSIQVCELCNDKNHMTNDCEKVKIFINQAKASNQIRCQLCDKWGHSGKECRNNNIGQNNFNQNKMFVGNNRNNNLYGQRIQTKFCKYCKNRGHNIEECRRIQYKKPQNGNQNLQCPYCKKLGHSIDSCFTLKNIESKLSKFCTFCKSINHTEEECQAKLNTSAHIQGNA